MGVGANAARLHSDEEKTLKVDDHNVISTRRFFEDASGIVLLGPRTRAIALALCAVLLWATWPTLATWARPAAPVSSPIAGCRDRVRSIARPSVRDRTDRRLRRDLA